MGWLLRISAGGILAGALAAGGALWGTLRMVAPGPLAEPATIVIARGEGLEAIAIKLGEAGVVESPLVFGVAARIAGSTRALKAGEYAFVPGVSIEGVIEQLQQGRTVVRRLTVPEGLTSAQVVTLLRNEPALTGQIATPPPDGTLLPQTYHYSYGDSREALLERMRAGMAQLVEEAWKARDPQVKLASPRDAVILASIVEKETGQAEERARVAGVFHNRLKAGMKLQSDPTVIYALTAGRGDLDRALTRADWKTDSPYNTYQIEGLPPGPIANPGKAALMAALKPERHDWLYFVADGGGGHAFAKTLAEHNRNVAQWRATQRRTEPVP